MATILPLAEAGISLKRRPRMGWIEAGVARPESVADHSYALTLLSMAAADLLGLDAEKMMRMALLHDLAEAFTSDLTPKKKKAAGTHIVRRLEKSILASVLGDLPQHMRERYAALLNEYLEGRSREARVLHLLDGVEMALEALRLRRERGLKLARFWRSAASSRFSRGIVRAALR